MKIDETKQKIIENSKQVFIEKGLKDVTMTDLVSVSGYSRGGVYRYFKTPTDIFKELMKQNILDLKESYQMISFAEYLAQEKVELLDIKNSLSLAGYEFMTSREDTDELGSLIFETHLEIIMNTKKCSKVEAQHIFLVLEGLRVMALTGIITEKIIEEAFSSFN